MDYDNEFCLPLIAYIREYMVERFSGRLAYREIDDFMQEVNKTLQNTDQDLMLYNGTLYHKTFKPTRKE